MRPFAGGNVRPGFIDSGTLFSEPVPRPVGLGRILRSVVAPELIVGVRLVGRIDTSQSASRTGRENNSDKSTGRLVCTLAGIPETSTSITPLRKRIPLKRARGPPLFVSLTRNKLQCGGTTMRGQLRLRIGQAELRRVVERNLLRAGRETASEQKRNQPKGKFHELSPSLLFRESSGAKRPSQRRHQPLNGSSGDRKR